MFGCFRAQLAWEALLLYSSSVLIAFPLFAVLYKTPFFIRDACSGGSRNLYKEYEFSCDLW